jgi:uncharacterized protein YgiM (DUF1202 family)/type II secretory pathway pseudopilin PulG
MNVQKILFLSLVICGLMLVACETSPTATPTLAPTLPPTPTLTDTPEPSPTALPPTPTIEPATATLAPPTATPIPPIATMKIIVNVRSGPGASYPLIGKLKKGDRRPILGKSDDSKWWQIPFENQLGWVAADFTDVQTGTNAVPVISVAPLPTPTIIATRVITTSGPTPTITRTPTLQLPAATGRIYFVVQQNGTLNTAWLRPEKKEQIFSDVTLGTSPGDFALNLSTNASPLDWSEAAGKLAYVAGTGTQNKLQTVDENSNVVTLDSHGAIVTPRWFSDGRRLAYIGYDNAFKNQAIYVINADGSKPGNYLCFPARSGETLRGLAVSRTSGDIAFVSDFSGKSEIWKIDRFCNLPVQLTHDNADDSAPAFSFDGTKLAFVSNKTGPTDHQIYVMNSDGTNLKRLGEGFTPAFSPDGFWLAFARNGEVYMMDINGGNIQTLTPGDHPTWAP